MHYLLPVWKACSKLVSLDINLQNNSLGDEGLKCFGDDLSNLKGQLKKLTLELKNTNITEREMVHFGKNLSKLSLLEKLEIHCGDNGLGAGIAPLGKAV